MQENDYHYQPMAEEDQPPEGYEFRGFDNDGDAAFLYVGPGAPPTHSKWWYVTIPPGLDGLVVGCLQDRFSGGDGVDIRLNWHWQLKPED